jgi:hypothetical protein
MAHLQDPLDKFFNEHDEYFKFVSEEEIYALDLDLDELGLEPSLDELGLD